MLKLTQLFILFFYPAGCVPFQCHVFSSKIHQTPCDILFHLYIPPPSTPPPILSTGPYHLVAAEGPQMPIISEYRIHNSCSLPMISLQFSYDKSPETNVVLYVKDKELDKKMDSTLNGMFAHLNNPNLFHRLPRPQPRLLTIKIRDAPIPIPDLPVFLILSRHAVFWYLFCSSSYRCSCLL